MGNKHSVPNNLNQNKLYSSDLATSQSLQPKPSKRNLKNATQDLVCETIDTCESIKRIKLVLQMYNETQYESVTTFANDITTTLNDYIHIVNYHNNNLQDVYNQFTLNKCECDLNTCTALKRNLRERMKQKHDTKSNDDNDSINRVIMDIMDQIHSYLYHSFDTGYRLTKEEKNILLKAATDSDEKNNDNVNISFNAIKSILKDKRKRFNSTFDRNNHSKFVTQTNIQQNNENNDKDEKYQSLEKYSFSYRFNYWSKMHKLYILPKHSSLKECMMSNSICAVNQYQWNDIKTKSMQYIKTENAKTIRANSYFKNEYNIKERELLSINNLMVIIFYTDMDELSYKFSQTFRHISDTETFNDLTKRHSNYHWFAKILRETVECYGDDYRPSSKLYFYHGLSCLMIFNSPIAKFNHPMSTTKQIIVAQSFATNYGIIIQIGSYSYTPCFSCSWISAYAYEDETLFVGGYKSLKIKNIINCMNGKEYKIYLSALNQLDQCLNNYGAFEATEQDTKILDTLFYNDTDDYSLLPNYFINIFKAYQQNTKRIAINIDSIKKYGTESSYFLSLLLTSRNNLEKCFVCIKNIGKVFKQLEKIEMDPGYNKIILLSQEYFDQVSSHLIEYPLPSVKDIIIKNVQLDKASNDTFDTITDLLNSVSTEFKKSTNFALEYKKTKMCLVLTLR